MKEEKKHETVKFFIEWTLTDHNDCVKESKISGNLTLLWQGKVSSHVVLCDSPKTRKWSNDDIQEWVIHDFGKIKWPWKIFSKMFLKMIGMIDFT